MVLVFFIKSQRLAAIAIMETPGFALELTTKMLERRKEIISEMKKRWKWFSGCARVITEGVVNPIKLLLNLPIEFDVV